MRPTTLAFACGTSSFLTLSPPAEPAAAGCPGAGGVAAGGVVRPATAPGTGRCTGAGPRAAGRAGAAPPSGFCSTGFGAGALFAAGAFAGFGFGELSGSFSTAVPTGPACESLRSRMVESLGGVDWVFGAPSWALGLAAGLGVADSFGAGVGFGSAGFAATAFAGAGWAGAARVGAGSVFAAGAAAPESEVGLGAFFGFGSAGFEAVSEPAPVAFAGAGAFSGTGAGVGFDVASGPGGREWFRCRLGLRSRCVGCSCSSW